MKVLVVAGAFYPAKKYGGPVVSIDNMCSLLKEDNDFYLIARDHDFGEIKKLENIKKGWNRRSNCQVKYLSDDDFRYEVFESLFTEISPDVVYINSLFDIKTTQPFLKICYKFKCPVLLAPRGQLCAGAFRRKYKKIPYIVYLKLSGLLKYVSLQSTSDEETEAIKKYLGIENDKIHYLTNIPSIPKKEYERTGKISGKGKFIFLSRIHPKKNLISAIKYFNGVQGDTVFDIYGPIEDDSYWKECQAEIEKLSKNVTVNYCGLVSHDEVHEVFSKYDAFLFPTFSENYGHVIAEALAVGTPVIISDQTPWQNLESERVGWDISLDNSIGFTNAIQSIVDINMNDYDLMSKKTKGYFVEKARLNELRNEYEVVFNTVSHRSN